MLESITGIVKRVWNEPEFSPHFSFYGHEQFIRLLLILISSSVKWGQDDLLPSAKRIEGKDIGETFSLCLNA